MADVQITLTIPSEKVTDFSEGFLAKCPVPMIEDPESTEENPLPNILEFTDKQWIKEWLKRQAIRAYKHGKKQLAEELAVIDEGLII